MSEAIRKIVLQENKSGLLRLPNVVGGGVGKRIRNGVVTNEDVIHVFVTTKVDSGQLASNHIVPKQIWSTATSFPIPTDVLEVGTIKLVSNQDFTRPIVGGLSISNVNSNSIGTMTGIFRDKSDNQPVFISNNHVIGNSNNANIGDLIRQPGFNDDTNFSNIGVLKRIVELQAQPTTNHVDGAVASLHSSLNSDYDIAITNVGVPRSVLLDPPINKLIQKSGRTSEHSLGLILSKHAFISGISYGPNVNYDFDDQILTTNILIAGDSGSLVLSLKNEIIGLGFAASDQVAIINPISYVFQELNIEPYSMIRIRSYMDRSGTKFYFKNVLDSRHDAAYSRDLGEKFLIYPLDVATQNTALLKRWKTVMFPYRYILSISNPGQNYSLDATIGRIATTQLEDSVALYEWINQSNNQRWYSTDPSGGGVNTQQFQKQQAPIGFAVNVLSKSYIL